ncbi:MAG: hypothetical protein ACLUZ1_04765 [Coprococcus sp.]
MARKHSEFESTVVGGAIPKEYIPAIGEGIEEAAQAGILGGFPVLGVHANVWDGSYHRSILPRWHSTSLVLWRSRKLCRRVIRFC